MPATFTKNFVTDHDGWRSRGTIEVELGEPELDGEEVHVPLKLTRVKIDTQKIKIPKVTQ